MKRRTMTLITVAVAAVALLAGSLAFRSGVEAHEDQIVGDWVTRISQKGPGQARIESLAGTWKTEVKLWPAGPNMEPQVMKGKATREWVLGGRFLAEKAENPGAAGDFQGVGYLGYNGLTGLYETVFMSTDSTAMYFESGRYDPVSNLIRMTGQYQDPHTGFMTQSRTEISLGGPEGHTITGYVTREDGREYKEIEIVYTR